MNRPVLILGAEPRIAVTIARSLYRRQIPVDVGVLTSEEPVLRSRAVRKFIRFPQAVKGKDEFLGSMRAQVEAAGYDMLIPTSDSTLTACLSCYEELSALLHVACPPPQITERVLNKAITVRVASEHGIRVPETYQVHSIEELECQRDALRFPIIAKPQEKSQTAEFKIRRFENYRELLIAFDQKPDFGTKNLIQEECKGVGVGIEVLLHRGEVVAMFQHRRLRELPATGGVSVFAVAEQLDPYLAEQAVSLLRALDWEGVAMVEFLVDQATGVANLMEVNGRYWGSLAVAVHAGVDFPFWHWQAVHGQTPDVPDSYRAGLRVRWLTGDLLRLYECFFSDRGQPGRREKWRELLRFLTDFRPSVKDMIWSRSDPRPGISELVRELRHLVAGGVKSLLGNLVPRHLKERLRTFRSLEPRAASIYVKKGLARALGFAGPSANRLPGRVETIVFVCHGNIIRSPMAAALLKKRIGTEKSIRVLSAGLRARPGIPADERASLTAPQFGVSLNQHRSQAFTSELADTAGLIVVMDFENEALLLSRFPQAGKKTYLLGQFNGKEKHSSIEIADPYDGDLTSVRNCYQRLEGHVETLADLLRVSS